METTASTRPSAVDLDIFVVSNHKDVLPLTKILSDQGRMIFELVNLVILSTIGGLFGIVSNIINIIVFFKQGFGNTVNISFFAIAISDMCSLISLEWLSICFNPDFENFGMPYDPLDIEYLSGAWPHVCFSRITGLITAYVTAERCLCIAIPLKIKQIVTPKRTTTIIICIYFVNIMSLVPEYATSYMDWKFYPGKNISLMALAYTHNRIYVEGLVFVLNSTLGVLSFVAVIFFTILLIVKLRQNTSWRKNASNKQEGVSTRDKKTVKMVIIIASILIVCYTPGVINAMTAFVIPEFSIFRGYANICISTWSFVFLFQVINSSVNIFLYYAMSSNYRRALYELIGRSATK